jgi:hypothetical protein
MPPALKEMLPPAYRALIPWVAGVALLSAAWAGARYGWVAPAHERLAAIEADRAAVKDALARRLEARQARKDLAAVMAGLPTSREFARLPLILSEMARADRVALPSLSYKLEKSSDGPATKAILQGTVIGQYEDLRRFLYHLESSDRVRLFVEDLSVGRSSDVKGERKGKRIAITVRIATYIREEIKRGAALRASAR